MIRLRNISILLLLILLGLPTVSKAKDTFYIQPFNIVPGDTKTISLNLDNENVYRGFQADIVLPEGLSIVKNANSSLAISLTNRASAFGLSSNEVGNRTTRLLCYSAQYETISGDNGALVNIQVKASSDFVGGYVQLKNTIFSNENNQDVNMDDSQVSVQTKEQNLISVADGELTAGKGKAFALELTNETSLTACQFDVVVPSGLSLDLAKCSVTGRCSSSHQLTSKDLGNGRYRFVCMSMDNTTFVGHLGTILNLWVDAEASARDHKKVKVENVVFSDAKAQTYRLDPITFDVNVSFVVATSIRLNESSLSLQVDDSRTLIATVLPENCTDKSVVWESSNEQVASVDANGNIIAKAEGQCVINAYSADRSVKAECSVTVMKIPLTVRVEDAARKYGDENPQFKISYEGFRDGDTETRLTTSAVAQTDANLKSAVGDYEIILSGAESNKYSFNYVVGKLSVTKAPLVISAGDYTKKQGDAMPEFKASYSGFKNSENEDVLTKRPVFSIDATESSAPADYVVNVSGAEAENYEITYQPGTLTVTEADAVIIRAKSNSRQYGDANPAFEYEVEGVALDGTPEIVCSAAVGSPVGTYTIEVRQGSVKNYNVHFENGTLTITKAPLVISAGDYTKKQGDAMPEFKASYSGFKNGENEAVLIKQPVFSTDATESSAPADYVVNVSGAEAENYDITYQSGVLKVIAKMKQSITWNQVIEANVGSTIEMNATASSGLEVRYSYYRPSAVYSAFHIPEINGDKITFPEIGSYLLIAVQDGDENYESAADTIQVNAIESDAGLMYIDGIYYKYVDDSNSALKVVRGYKPYSGRVEIPATVYGLPVKRLENQAFYASQYLNEVILGNNIEKSGSYETFGACLNLQKVTLPDNKGFVLEDWTFNCDGGINEIHCRSQIPYVANERIFNGAVDYNTCILYVPKGCKDTYAQAEEWKKFTHIVEEDVPMAIVKVKSCSREYGEENPTFDFETEGVPLNGDPSFVCAADKMSGVGTYSIEGVLGSITNTNVSFLSGVLTVEKAPLVVSAGNYTKIQGNGMPEFKASYMGFKNDETEDVLTKKPVFSTDATESSSPADYVVNISGAEATNYDITYLPGILTVTEMPAPVMSIVNKELQISTELDNAVIYYTLDGTEPDENSKVYSDPISLYASCVIKAIAVVGGVKSKVTETEFRDAQYPDIVKVGDLITANIINNSEENLLMAFRVTSVFPFEVTMIHRSNYQEGWNNEQITGDIEVPSSVTANGISYSVKRIGDSALAYTPKAASLKLNEGLEYIESSAFRCFGELKMKELVVPNSVKVVGGAFVTECNSLNTLVLGTGVERLQRDAFWGIGALKEIYSLNSIPPVCDVPDQTFVDIPDDVTLYVPVGSKEAYETTPGWNHFAGHIVEIDPTAIKPVVISVKDDALWYNLQGVKSSEKPTAPGIYVHGGKKVIIK